MHSYSSAASRPDRALLDYFFLPPPAARPLLCAVDLPGGVPWDDPPPDDAAHAPGCGFLSTCHSRREGQCHLLRLLKQSTTLLLWCCRAVSPCVLRMQKPEPCCLGCSSPAPAGPWYVWPIPWRQRCNQRVAGSLHARSRTHLRNTFTTCGVLMGRWPQRLWRLVDRVLIREWGGAGVRPSVPLTRHTRMTKWFGQRQPGDCCGGRAAGGCPCSVPDQRGTG